MLKDLPDKGIFITFMAEIENAAEMLKGPILSAILDEKYEMNDCLQVLSKFVPSLTKLARVKMEVSIIWAHFLRVQVVKKL